MTSAQVPEQVLQLVRDEVNRIQREISNCTRGIERDTAKCPHGSDCSQCREMINDLTALRKSYEKDRNVLKSFLEGSSSGWLDPIEDEPEDRQQLLAKDPDGTLHLTSWRGAYGVFSCQGKQDSIFGWTYKKIV